MPALICGVVTGNVPEVEKTTGRGAKLTEKFPVQTNLLPLILEIVKGANDATFKSYGLNPRPVILKIVPKTVVFKL